MLPLNEDKARHTPAVNKEFPAALLTNQKAKVTQVSQIPEKSSGSKNRVTLSAECMRDRQHYYLQHEGFHPTYSTSM